MSTSGTAQATESTRIAVHLGEARVRVGLVTGALAPRLIERNATSATVALAAAQMLLLDGDAVHIEIEVGDGCALEIQDIGGTVAYPGSSSWEVRARIGAGGRLLWRGLPFVVTTGARVRRRTDVVLDLGAAALIRETIVLGRHGEVGGAVDSGITALGDEGPILVERLEAKGSSPGPGVLGDARVVDSVLALGYRPSSEAGDVVLEQAGAIARFLGNETHTSGLDSVWAAWRAALLRQVTSPSGGPRRLVHPARSAR
jgi:urease accessory protein